MTTLAPNQKGAVCTGSQKCLYIYIYIEREREIERESEIDIYTYVYTYIYIYICLADLCARRRVSAAVRDGGVTPACVIRGVVAQCWL